jgi:hypothetical protein
MKPLFLRSVATLLALAVTLSSALAAHAQLGGTPPANKIYGSYHAQRGQQRLKKMPRADAQRLKNLIAKARSVDERNYLYKAFAVGHNLKALTSFATLIRGKDKVWLRNNLRATNSSTATGIVQLWQDSCGPTTAAACIGDLDPIFAYRYRTGDQALLQKQWLQKRLPSGAQGGLAVPRGATGGRGRFIEDIISAQRSIGLTYNLRTIQGTYTIDKAVRELDAALPRGLPVPLVVRSQANTTHYVLAIAHWKMKGQKVYTIHDPGQGKTVIRTEKQLRSNQLSLSGNDQLVNVSIPTSKASR